VRTTQACIIDQDEMAPAFCMKHQTSHFGKLKLNVRRGSFSVKIKDTFAGMTGKHVG
jgi:hypothetical protein